MEREHRPETQYHEREKSLTPADLADIVKAFDNRQPHVCRFESVTREDFEESVKFYKHWNDAMQSGGSIIAKTLLVLLITFIAGIAGNGFISSVISWVKKGP